MKILIVIDMQNDFITGVLGNADTASVVGKVVKKINDFHETEKDGRIIATLDTHFENYLSTQEGKNLPIPHCIKGTNGWNLVDQIKSVLSENDLIINKETFGAIDLSDVIGKMGVVDEIQIIGVCTDICVISNAIILKAAFPEVPIKVISSCCAGVTPESHENALNAMKVCQIIIEE